MNTDIVKLLNREMVLKDRERKLFYLKEEFIENGSGNRAWIKVNKKLRFIRRILEFKSKEPVFNNQTKQS